MRKIIILIMSLLLAFSSVSVSFCGVEESNENAIKIKVVPNVGSASNGDYITFDFKIESIPDKTKQISNAMEAYVQFDSDIMSFSEFSNGTCGKSKYNILSESLNLAAYREDNAGYKEGDVLFSVIMKIKDDVDADTCSISSADITLFNDTENGKSIPTTLSFGTVNIKKKWDTYSIEGNLISQIKELNENVEIQIGDIIIYNKRLSTKDNNISLTDEKIDIQMSDFITTSQSLNAVDIDKLPLLTIKIGNMIYKKKLSVSDLKIDGSSNYIIALGDMDLVQGNVNKDMTIDMKDANLLSDKVGESTLDTNFDINIDGKIDIKDLFYVSKSYGY